MLGIFLIICLIIYLFLDLKAYFLLKEEVSQDSVELCPEARIYELCTPARKLNTISLIVMLIGYLGCMFPYLFVEGVETKAYIAYIVTFGISPILLIAYICYLNIKYSHGCISISSDTIEYIGHKSFFIQIEDIKNIRCSAVDCYQIHFKKSAKKKALNINVRSFYKNKEIRSLVRQLNDRIAKTSGLEKSFGYKMRCFRWMLERLGLAYFGLIKILLLLTLLYTSYCCIDYDFFRKDYTALYNGLNADSTQSENAWGHYVQAAGNYVKLEDELQDTLGDITEPNELKLTNNQKEQIVKWFNDNSVSWESLRQAVSIKYCNATYKDISFLNHSDRDDFLNPNDTGYSQIKYLYSNINTARLTGTLDIDWFELFEVQLASSRHFAHGKSFIDQLVGYATLHRAIDVFVDRNSYEPQDLQKVKTTLMEYFPNGVPPLNVEGEILISCGLFDDMINRVDIPIQTPLNPMFLMLGPMSRSEEHVRNRYNSILEDAEKGIEVETENFSFFSFPVMRNLLVGIVEPSLSKVYRISQRTETTLSAAYVILDLEKYNLLKECYPVDILQLKDVGLSSKLPDDPDSDGSIIYSNDGKRAILYAVGKNGRDDGGYKDSRKSDGERDDRIFWERKLQ